MSKESYFKQFSLAEHKYTISMSKTVAFQTIQISIKIQFQREKTVLFQTIQFSISTQFKYEKQFVA